ncbi:MAG TPA: TrmH family RNA methyltransferase [Gemmatimonadales bacterium]|nr:TrmH family RNA methyltransferase [Gemmatimonadales bacterium]
MTPDATTAPVLVLVAVQDLVNLASCIRVAKNFGITEIRLVRPECSLDPYRLEGIAHNTADVIAAMRVFDTLDEAFADLSYVQALTGRERTAKRTVLRPRAAAAELVSRSAVGRVGILAGREDHGLQNEELDRCNVLVTISANPAYTSLNLAQATGIYAYETWLARGGDDLPLKLPRHHAPPAPQAEVEALFRDWEASLTAIEFFKKREPELVMRGFREVIFRADLDAREVGLFRAIGLEIGHFLRRRGVLPPLPRRGGTPPADPGTPDRSPDVSDRS